MNFFKFLFFLIFLSCFTSICFAENSATISVSCTVPEIPGLNAPALETQTLITINPQEIDSKLAATQEKSETKETATTNIEQVQTVNTDTSNSQTQVLLKTIYTR